MDNFDKIPPQAIDVEEAVLGAILIEKDALFSVLSLIKPEYFYKDQHCKIYQAIVDVSKEAKDIDILTVTNKLRKQNILEEVGGPTYITELSGKTSSAAHLETHVRIVYDAYVKRELIRLGNELMNNSFADEMDPRDLMDQTTAQFIDLSGFGNYSEPVPISLVVDEERQRIEDIHLGISKPGETKTLLTDLDRKLGPLESDLIYIAARPSMGKSSMAVQLANNLSVIQNKPGAIFELEMRGRVLSRWMCSQITQIDNEVIKGGRMSDVDFNLIVETLDKIKKAPLYIDDSSGYNILQLRSKALKLKHKHNIEYIIVDYLQLLSGVSVKGVTQNRENEVSSISRGLKDLTKELDIPVIVLSQLNRMSEQRSDRRPMLSDLRESGAIEQDADIVIFIHRPEKHGIKDIMVNGLPVNTKNMAEIIIAKHRDGATGSVMMRFFPETVSFKNYLNNEIIEPFKENEIIPF